MTRRAKGFAVTLALGLGWVLAMAAPARAVDCTDITFETNGYTLCEVTPATEDLRLFLADPAGETYGHFTTLNQALQGEGKRLAFAMNAGMYHEDRSPVGHYLENGEEVMRVIPNAGPGNFGLLPNGVLCLGDNSARVFETLRYQSESPACRFATQSGPMLVIDGKLHPRFLPDSTSRYIRNGVGTSAEGDRAVFAISRNPVTFYEFGRLFRDHLKLPQALYFDGNVSRLYAPSISRADAGFRLGPIVGVVEADE